MIQYDGDCLGLCKTITLNHSVQLDKIFCQIYQLLYAYTLLVIYFRTLFIHLFQSRSKCLDKTKDIHLFAYWAFLHAFLSSADFFFQSK